MNSGTRRKRGGAVVVNRRAGYDYALSDDIEVGMVLNGVQVRLIRDHHAQLKGTYVTVRNGELWLLGLTLGSETAENIKLLATRKQIDFLMRRKKDGLTVVPTKLLPLRRHIKLVIAVGKGKRTYDKRRVIRARDLDREKRTL